MLTIVPVTRIGGVWSSTWSFDRLPTSIYAWRPLPSNISLRAERDSPYAAVQTLCWAPQRMEHGTTPAPTQEDPDSMSRTSDVSPSAQSTPANWGGLAVSACLVGGAAICAWIVLGHSLLRPPRRPTHDSIVARPVTPAQPKIASMDSALPPSSTAVRASAALALGTELVPPQGTAKNTVVAHEHRRAGNGRLAFLHTRRQSGPHGLGFARPVSSHRRHTHSLAGHHVHRLALPAMTGAGPHVPVTLPRGDSLGGAAAPRATDATDKDPTEWMNHMSQRRITDVSGAFSK